MPVRRVALDSGRIKTRVDGLALARLLAHLRPDIAFVEQVGTHSGEGPMGAFSFGRSLGALEGGLGAIGLQATEVSPQTWKRRVGVRKGPGGDTKGPALEKVRRLWPECEHLFRRKKDNGRADAALIALYGYETVLDL